VPLQHNENQASTPTDDPHPRLVARWSNGRQDRPELPGVTPSGQHAI